MIKAAGTWLKAATDDIRNERLAPLAEQARTIWRRLRQESNVDLGAIRLAGSAPSGASSSTKGRGQAQAVTPVPVRDEEILAERAVVLAVPDLVSALGIVPACPTYHLLLHLLRARRGARPAGSLSCTVDRMSAQAADHPDPDEPYEVIHLGGEAAAIVPLAELRRLRAVERYASPEALEEAEIEATLAAHDEWVAAGCPGARSHEDVMAELLGGDQ